MTSADGIRDEASLRAWLEGRPREDVLRIAHRIAAKVLPISEPGASGYEPYRAALAALRWALFLQVWAYAPGARLPDDFSSHFDRAEQDYISLDDSFDPPIPRALEAQLYGVVCGFLTLQPSDHFTDANPITIFRARDGIDALLETHTRAHSALDRSQGIMEAGQGRDIADVVAEISSIQSGRPEPLELTPHVMGLWSRVRDIWEARGSDWDFWINWYVDILVGREPDWDLLKAVSDIPYPIWKRGPAAVAAEIARIEKRLRLLREVARLKTDLAGARAEIAALARRSHNNPPELVEPVAEVERQVGVLVEPLIEAETELAKDAPQPAVLSRVSHALLKMAAKSLAYCASLADTAGKNAAATAGKAAGPVLVAMLIGKLEAVQVFAQALLAFAKSLGGG